MNKGQNEKGENLFRTSGFFCFFLFYFCICMFLAFEAGDRNKKIDSLKESRNTKCE